MAQTAMTAGAGRDFRLDPYQGRHILEVGNKTIKLDRNGAVVKQVLECGLPVAMAVPARAFKGVAARAIETGKGIRVSLELLHHDPKLCVPLLLAEDMDHIAADWHSWSRMLKLPMLIIDAENNPSKVRGELGRLMVETPWERRKRITAVKHRPNFLRRRKPGRIGEVVRITAEEIIARR